MGKTGPSATVFGKRRAGHCLYAHLVMPFSCYHSSVKMWAVTRPRKEIKDGFPIRIAFDSPAADTATGVVFHVGTGGRQGSAARRHAELACIYRFRRQKNQSGQVARKISGAELFFGYLPVLHA